VGLVAKFVYIDETGSATGSLKKHPYLMLVAAIVDESSVRALAAGLRRVALEHLEWIPPDVEFHGVEIWHGKGHWEGKEPPALLAAYEAAISLLDAHDIDIAHATINRVGLHDRYDGNADENAYVLALQFLLEKLEANVSGHKVLIADEAKEQQLRAIKMFSDMQRVEWGGPVPGRQLTTFIDSLHFVSSQASAGVQMADLVAYVLQRYPRPETHPDVQAARDRMITVISNRTRTWRDTWP
jgi:hypothetical protein